MFDWFKASEDSEKACNSEEKIAEIKRVLRRYWAGLANVGFYGDDLCWIDCLYPMPDEPNCHRLLRVNIDGVFDGNSDAFDDSFREHCRSDREHAMYKMLEQLTKTPSIMEDE